MSFETGEELFEHLIQDMYYAEKKLVKALGEMAGAATDPKLKAAFLSHQKETEIHAERIEDVLEALDMKVKAEKCDAINGLIKEANDLISSSKEDSVRDIALIVAAQKVEHYEIASYGTICELAETLGYGAACAVLGKTLDEEKAADEKLTSIAESGVNTRGLKKAA